MMAAMAVDWVEMTSALRVAVAMVQSANVVGERVEAVLEDYCDCSCDRYCCEGSV